jgi:hypothetical protein
VLDWSFRAEWREEGEVVLVMDDELGESVVAIETLIV